MSEQELRERIHSLEQRLALLTQPTGFAREPGLNVLGQNSQVRGDLTIDGELYVNRPHIVAHIVVGPSIPDSTPTRLTGWVADSLHDCQFDPGAGLFYGPAAGVYLITANVFWAASAVGARIAYLARGSDGLWIAHSAMGANTSNLNGHSLSTIWKLGAWESVGLDLWQNTGGPLAIDVGGKGLLFSMTRIA